MLKIEGFLSTKCSWGKRGKKQVTEEGSYVCVIYIHTNIIKTRPPRRWKH